MAKTSPITIIDDNNLRGVIAPSKVLSKKLLEDIIDLLELSSPESIEEDKRLIKEADEEKSWIPGEEIEKELGISK